MANPQTHPSLTDIISYISPAGWTIHVALCVDLCSDATCRVPPTSCGTYPAGGTVHIDTTYIDVPNLVIRQAPAAGTAGAPIAVITMDDDTYASEAANNESYPCSPFIVTTHNVSIIGFKFATEACVANVPAFIQISGLPPSIFWLMTTPVIVMADVAPLTRLDTLSWSNTASQTSRGDAIVRIIPSTPDTVIDLNGSVFTGITGRVDTASPVSKLTPSGTSNAVPALLIAPYSGIIVVNANTRFATLRTDTVDNSIGAWMGSSRAMVGLVAEECPVCKTAEQLHRTNMIYVYVAAAVTGVAIIVVIILIIVHVRDRRKMDQKAIDALTKNE